MTTPVIVRDLGATEYAPVFEAMRQFTGQRDARTTDEIWFTEHAPVFTQGQAGRSEHLLAPEDIPVVQSDRGGQVTYHGPGQITAYLLFDLRRKHLGVRDLVTGIECAMVETIARFGIVGEARGDAPGVYVAGAKIGALGLRVRHGRSYHGLSLNVAMDLAPFARINPCGLLGMQVTQIAEFASIDIGTVREVLRSELLSQYDLHEVTAHRTPHTALDAPA